MARTSRYGGPYTPQRGAFAGQTFPSYYKYRDAQAQDEGYKGYSDKRKLAKEAKSIGISTERMSPNVKKRDTLEWRILGKSRDRGQHLGPYSDGMTPQQMAIFQKYTSDFPDVTVDDFFYH